MKKTVTDYFGSRFDEQKKEREYKNPELTIEAQCITGIPARDITLEENTCNELVVSIKNFPSSIRMTDRTILPAKTCHFKKNEKIVFVVTAVNDHLYDSFAVFSEPLYSFLMDGTNNYMQFRERLDSYLSLSSALSDESIILLLRQGTLENHPSLASPQLLNVTEYHVIKHVYPLLKWKYLPEQRMKIEQWMKNPSPRQKEKLVKFLNILPATILPELPLMEFFNKMDRLISGHAEVKKSMAEILLAGQKSLLHPGFSILCYGNPGVGKTAFGKSLAKALGIQYELISLEACTSPLDVIGCNETYTDSHPGRVFDFISRTGSGSMIIYDEIDKASSVDGKDGNLAMTLLELVGESYFRDAYMDIPCTNAQIIWCTANDIDKISKPLYDRFDMVLHFEDMTEEDKIEYAEKIVIPELTEEYGSLVTLEKDVLIYIIQNYTSDDGGREIRSRLKEIWLAVFSQLNDSGKEPPLTVNKEFVDETFESSVPETPWLLIHRRKKEYSDEEWYHIHDLYVKSLCTDDPTERNNLNRVIKEISEVDNHKTKIDVNPQILYDALESSHYGQQSIKETLVSFLYGQSISGKSIPLLLEGPPGTGKSSVIESLARAMGIGFYRIACGGADAATFKGVSRSFGSSSSGRIIEALRRVGRNGFILFDEIDKLGTGHVGERGADALFDLFDDTHLFTDNFWGFPLDLSGVLFAATANDIDRMDPALKSRFKIVSMPGYTRWEKMIIARKYLLPILSKRYHVQITAADDVIGHLVHNYTSEEGVRDLKHMLTDVVERTLTAYAYAGGGHPEHMTITEEIVDNVLKPYCII